MIRILLVDDESAILRSFRYCLEDEGYSVATASSAQQAENLLQRQVFDLCFLDLRLGDDNGLDVLAQMRVQAPWMRVVIVTAHSAVDTAVDAMQAGADAINAVNTLGPGTCLDPVTGKKRYEESPAATEGTCTMCGKMCAVRTVNKVFEGTTKIGRAHV